ncbi:MAG TPA: lipopolysaccharide kinase InaA family protein, partial [Lacipirellulaceae bacterium]|nr:lipopolysaccharide kinase InaA family protein [Lacipirellulaceae bacterium]
AYFVGCEMSSRWPESMYRRSFTRMLCCDADLSAELQGILWQGDLDRLLFTSASLQVKDRCIVARHEDDGHSLVVKRNVWGGPLRTLRMAWRESSARRCAWLGHYLSERGIPTPRPRAWVEERLGPLKYRSYLFTDFVEGTSLYRFVRSVQASADVLEDLAGQVASIWQRFEELGATHGDMKPENFIIDPDLRVWVLDLERVRIDGIAKLKSQRPIADVETFLHIRGWHHRPEAREIFRREFARTEAGRRLGLPLDLPSGSSAARRAAETDATLSVLILCDDEHDSANTQQAIESVRDIADEVVIGACRGAGSNFERVRRLVLCEGDSAHCDWLLVLHQNECVTPILAKRLQEAITGDARHHAFRIGIERQFFGHSLSLGNGTGNWPIRLFRPQQSSFSVANGELTIAADPERIGQLEGTIQQTVATSVSEFVAFLDQQTTGTAEQRWQDGEFPRWITATTTAVASFLKRCVGVDGIRSGWVGVHLAALEAVFRWVEEVKLWQMSGQFHAVRSTMSADDVDDGALPDVRRMISPISELPLSKAA